jgi:uncharacterized lipoprotein YmbA
MEKTMKYRIWGRFFTVLLCMAALFQLSCAGRSKQARFYVLTPEPDIALEMTEGPGIGSDITIGISPVSLPKYLKKQQIVTRSGDNELQLAEYDRWAGKLEEDIGRVIAENLSRLLGSDNVFASPALAAIARDYDVKIDITRFEGLLGGDFELSARWSIVDSRGEVVAGIKATEIIEPTQGGGYDYLVAAQSRALAAFSRELANVLKELAGG